LPTGNAATSTRDEIAWMLLRLVLPGSASSSTSWIAAWSELIGNRHDARGAAAVGEGLVILAYGATIRAAGRWEHEAWAGRCVR
jgi:hypothetical protein